MAIDTGVKHGGNGILGAIGSVLGVLAAPFTGGTSLGATLAAAGTGAAVGGTVGHVADVAAGTAGGDEHKDTLSGGGQKDPYAITTKALDPSKTLEDSMAALSSPQIPDQIKAQAAPVLTQAYAIARRAKQLTPGVIS